MFAGKRSVPEFIAARAAHGQGVIRDFDDCFAAGPTTAIDAIDAFHRA